MVSSAETVPESWVYLWILFFIEACILIIANIIASTVILSSKHLRSIFNYILLCLLFITHVFTGLFIVIRVALLLWIKSDTTSALEYVTLLRDTATSLEVHLTILISVERFIAIRKPFLYAKMTKIHAAIGIGIAFALTIVFSINRIFWSAYFIPAFVVTFTGGLVTTISNYILYRSVKRQCMEIAATIVDRSGEKQKKRRELMKKRQLRSLKICIWIAASYILTWFLLIGGATVQQQVKSMSSNYLILFALVGYSNGLWDVIIFFHWNNTAKRQFRKLIHVSKAGEIDVSETEGCKSAVTENMTTNLRQLSTKLQN
ncbi:green-sensitive opsin-2-like [Clytia hemisphaerica]|uniref:G-protein coupled receptors family 1 profile domain-containing protein n=1 Tax=Clytia hemisphaerica TaxID=252671 RepID=A0A7M6DQA6_9CNID